MDLARLPAVGAAASSAGFPSGRRKQRRKQPEEEEDGPSSSFESGYLSLPEEEEGGGGLGSPASALLPPEPSALLLGAKVDFFRKLGYPPAEILSALRKHGPASDTNTILGELVQHAVAAAAAPGGPQGAAKESPTEPQAPPPDAAEPPLLPRGGAARHGTAGTAAASLAERKEVENLRPVVIDGSNVAMSHGDRDVFSCRGILLAVNWFLDRGHTDITVFVPSWRKEQPRPDFPITDQPLLLDLEKRKIVVFTPSRRVGGKRVVCYDDRFIVKLAYESDGVVVSNDTYRDLQSERPEWKKFIEERLLMYSFVNDKFMPPDDPLGRHGPSLDNFLRKKPVVPEHKTQLCPYGKKCTYGVKCKFFHPERLHQHQHRSVADELRAKAQLSPTQGIPMAKEERVSRRSSNEGEKLHSQKASAEKKSPAATQGQPGEGPPYVAGVTTLKGSGYLPHNWYPPPPISLQMDSLGYSSQDQLDSGLGSLESQMLDMWPSHGLRSHEEALGRGSCSQSLAYLGHSNLGHSRSYGQYPPQGYPKGPLGYTSELPPGRGPPHSFPGYTFPADPSLEPGQKYWSEPYPMGSVPHRERPRGPPGPPYDPPSSSSSSSGQWPMPDRFAEERANVRVRLCGIFHPHLVDAVMSRFPQMLDPQQLAAKILTYKSQNPQV